MPAPATPTAAPALDEASRRAALRRMKWVANGMLILAAAIYLLARWLEREHGWAGYLRATAEASMVGGLADWFAVTALFRHPLGLPIPHTAILQKQKDRVGRILGNFVQNHFLSRQVLETRLGGLNPAVRFGTWLSLEVNRKRLARELAGGIARAVEALPGEQVRGVVQAQALLRLREVKLAPLAGELLDVAAADNRPQELLDAAIRLIAQALHQSHEAIREMVRKESPRWLPLGLRDMIAERMINGIDRLILELEADPDHPMRQRFNRIVVDFITRLKSSPEMALKAEQLKDELLDKPLVEEFVRSLWERTREAATRYRSNPEGTSVEPVEELLAGLADSLLNSQPLQLEIDRVVIDILINALDHNRNEIADLIAITVAGWDPAVAAERIELAVGRDLQFVRLNGTLVGGLAGLAIYCLSELLG